jgi:drug/metabolite transporter (DMT)-like permease
MKTNFAIRLMIAQAVLFAIETAVIHAIGGRVSIMTLAFVRSAGGVVLALALAHKAGINVVHTRQMPLQLLRGAVSLLYLWVMIYSFAHMPFADATAISYTQAAYIAVFSALILGEVVTGSRWAASALGIAGALLIAKPGFVGWNAIYYLVALLGTSLNGLSFVLNRYLQRDDSQATTLFYSNLVPLLGNLPALAFAGLPSADTMFWLPGLLFLGPLGMLAGIVAVRHAEASMLAPYTLLRLVVSVAAGLVLFHEAPDVLSGIGAGAILASCLMATGIVPFKAIRHLYWRLWAPARA